MRWLALLMLFASPAWAQYPPPVPPLNVATASCTAACTVVLSIAGYSGVVAQATGTGSGMTFAFQGTVDSGTNWQTLFVLPPSAAPTFASSFSANGYWLVPTAGFQQVRVNLTSIGGGTETFTLSGSVSNNVVNP